jgi:two-component system cell cycle sensor histidine kinase/response regulator CckA
MMAVEPIVDDPSSRREIPAPELARRHRAFVEATGLAMLELDPDGRMLSLNPAAQTMFGYASRESLGGHWMQVLLPPEDRPTAQSLMNHLKETGLPQRADLHLLHKDGRVLETEWHLVPLHDEDGRLLGHTAVVQDQTERKRTETSLRQAQKLESLGILAGGIAHDFNNLLTAILGHVDLALGKAGEGGDIARHLKQVESTARRAAELSRQMLAYSGRGPFVVRPLDLSASVLEMTNLLQASLPKKVKLDMDLAGGLPAVHGDPVQMQQVLLNLVINAGEAIGDQMGHVVIRTRGELWTKESLSATFPGQVLEPGNFVRLEVKDDGMGMDAETIGRIFDPFFTTKFTGRGLGLSAMLGIVRGHHAGIRVDSVKGQGTTFVLLFPAGDGKAAAPEEEIRSTVQRLRGEVLVVDDEEVVRDLAVLALEAMGLRVHVAHDGAEGVERARLLKDQLRMVLLDLTMPRMGGDEVLRHLREMAPGLPVILTSGYGERETLRGLSDLRPEAFLQKPFRVAELQRMVRKTLGEP